MDRQRTTLGFTGMRPLLKWHSAAGHYRQQDTSSVCCVCLPGHRFAILSDDRISAVTSDPAEQLNDNKCREPATSLFALPFVLSLETSIRALYVDCMIFGDLLVPSSSVAPDNLIVHQRVVFRTSRKKSLKSEAPPLISNAIRYLAVGFE